MRALLSAVPNDKAVETRSGSKFQLLFGNQPAERQDRWARVYVLAMELGREFVETRLDSLRTQRELERPPPYDQQELAGLTPDDEFLVSVSEAQHDGSLRIGDIVCQAALTTPSPNSMYWLMGELSDLPCERKVRLDPLLVSPASEYRQMMYLMTVYGVPLEWKRIARLREPLFARWMPEVGTMSDVAFTDVVWTPRDDGVHFCCEEVPALGAAHRRGARYFHSIYDPVTEKFVHADGALRIYSEQELGDRHEVHVRKGGKQGARTKVFSANGGVPRDRWCRVVAAFFVWNSDVQDYVGGKDMGLEMG
jgi:hypothetical protein